MEKGMSPRFVLVGIGLVAGAALLALLFNGSDQDKLERCIGSLMNAARGTGMYGQYQELLQAQKTGVKKIAENRFGEMRTINYEFYINGRRRELLCHSN